jgi:hypothetical protein
MIADHKSFPPIVNTTAFDARQAGPLIVPVTLIAALTSSLDYPPSRITLVSTIGTIGLTVHQAAKLRDQLDEAIAAVIASCPEMAAADEKESP